VLTALAPAAPVRRSRRNPSDTPEVFERTLQHLYTRRATLENLIRSLETYQQTLEMDGGGSGR
jgi:hypothetical protein